MNALTSSNETPLSEGRVAALQLREVHKQFGQTQIIRGVDLKVQTGERHALIGPNGAGKSTLFHLISGRITLSSGDIPSWDKVSLESDPSTLTGSGYLEVFRSRIYFPA